jgi:hypothetical protein
MSESEYPQAKSILEHIETRERELADQAEQLRARIEELSRQLGELDAESENLRITRKTLLTLPPPDVADAVGHQHGLGDAGERVQPGRVGLAPFAERGQLGVHGGVAGGLVPVVDACEDPLHVGETRGPARPGRVVVEEHQILRPGHRVRGGGQHGRGQVADVLATFGGGAGQHETAHEGRFVQGQDLGDEPTERVAEQVDLRQPERADEVDDVRRGLGDVVAWRAGRTAHPGVVDGDDFAAFGERVEQRRIPVVEVAPETLQQKQRCCVGVRVAEAAVGVVDAVGCGDRQVRRTDACGHGAFLVTSDNNR